MSHPVWNTKEGRRAVAIAQVLRWPAIGALIVGGGFLAARVLGPGLARELGHAGGDAFAEGVARTQSRLAALTRDSRWG